MYTAVHVILESPYCRTARYVCMCVFGTHPKIYQLSDVVLLCVQARPVLDRATHAPNNPPAGYAPGRPRRLRIYQRRGRSRRVYNTPDLRGE